MHHFQRWFVQCGESELEKKYPRNSDLWFVFYDFGSKELFNYTPAEPQTAEFTEASSEMQQSNEVFDIAMIDDVADSLLSK